ncbi:MAG: OmpA family protein [Flavobacteriaceae bacterium]
MTKTTTNLIGIIIVILAGIYFYVMYCSECNAENQKEAAVESEMVKPTVPEATSYPFSFSDGDFAYNLKDNFNFNVSSASFLEPLSQNVKDAIVPGLKNFLTENANKVINIVGLYKNDEKNPTAFPNLGFARANAVKNYFISQEISSDQINIDGKLMPDMVAEGKIFLGPVGYSLGEKSATLEEEMSALLQKIMADPLVLYFDTGEATINLNASQRQKVADISRYLDKVKGARCDVIGDTDNVGKRRDNIRLGQERADFIKSYLANNGIAATKIKADSKGPRDPIASNDTEEGRAKNRRTVVTLNN